MKFSYNWLKELAGFKESPQKLAEFLTLKAFEVESVAKKGGDWVLDIKLLPNRIADVSGHVGMAREIATLKNSRVTYHVSRLKEAPQKASDALRVKIENPDDCPRYTVRVMAGVKVGPAPKWMAERLETCGLQAINSIVDGANYVMLETGQPLHVFDYDRLQIRNPKSPPRAVPRDEIRNKSQKPKRKTIIVRRAHKGEKLLALDDKTYPLSPEIIVIADEKEPIAIAGIKGGKESGVSAKTNAIILESANFDPVRTHISSRLLNLKTDAAWRFERGLDPNETAAAIDRLAELIQQVAGGEILAGRVDEYPRPLRPSRILLRVDYANGLIGEKIPAAFYESSFTRLRWEWKKKTPREYVVMPPTERRDIQIEEDIIEEIVRLWGYGRIAARPPAVALNPVEVSEERQWEATVKDFLVAAGATEALVYSFLGTKLLAAFGDRPDGPLELENPTSPETQYLARHPAHQFLRITAENLRHRDRVTLFGIAKGFKPAKKPSPHEPVDERKLLVLTAAAKGADAETFYELKGVIEHLLEGLGIAEHWYDDALTAVEKKKARALHPYRVAKVMADGETLGVVAEVHPKVQERLKAKARLVLAELDFEKLWKAARSEAEFKPIGKYPAVVRDIAVIMPENAKADDVEGVIHNAGSKLLTDSDLFDYFQDEAMAEADQKSLAFHLIFQSPERTLTDGEVNRLYKKIASALKAQGWEIRE